MKTAIGIWVLLGVFVVLLCGLVIATVVAVVLVLLHVGFSPLALWLCFTAYLALIATGTVLQIKTRS